MVHVIRGFGTMINKVYREEVYLFAEQGENITVGFKVSVEPLESEFSSNI